MPPPRGLVPLAALWIAGSWLLCFGPRAPLHPTVSGFLPGVRLLVTCLAVGLCAAWPLLRLSGPRERWPIRSALVDAATLATMLQVILWPLRLTTAWAPARLLLIDALLLSWMLVCAAIVSSAMGSARPAARAWAMLGCLLVTVLGLLVDPLLEAASIGPAPAWALGPVLGALQLISPDSPAQAAQTWAGVCVVVAVAATGFGLSGWRRRAVDPVAPSAAHR
jgi:hypothetical protein